MANQVTLKAYLQQGLPALTVNPPPNPMGNTTHPDKYDWSNIHGMLPWPEFNIARIEQAFGPLLSSIQLPPNPIFGQTQHPVNSENLVQLRVAALVIPCIQEALRLGFEQLGKRGELIHRTKLSINGGDAAVIQLGFKPDTAFYDVNRHGTGPNRAPGDIKPSWKWKTEWQHVGGRSGREFKQALSQVNWYMWQNRAKYGFILTDKEMVAFRRTDRPGHLKLSAPIPWTASGTANNMRMTVLTALWYLGMLASIDQAGPDQWWM